MIALTEQPFSVLLDIQALPTMAQTEAVWRPAAVWLNALYKQALTIAQQSCIRWQQGPAVLHLHWVHSALQHLPLGQQARVLPALYCSSRPAPVALELSILTGHDVRAPATPLRCSRHC